MYTTVIGPGHSPTNDMLMSELARGLRWVRDRAVREPEVLAATPFYLDVGCNGGWLLSSVPGGIGLDASPAMVAHARAAGHRVVLGQAEQLPFPDRTFLAVTFGCVLEQIEAVAEALAEAKRVALSIYGITPTPGKSPWGVIGGSGGLVKSVIKPRWFVERGYTIFPLPDERYYMFAWVSR